MKKILTITQYINLVDSKILFDKLLSEALPGAFADLRFP